MKNILRYAFFPILLFILAVGVLTSLPAYSNDQQPLDPNYPYEHIVKYISEISVRKNGTIDVTERITYDFGSVNKHGIFRYIPYQYPWYGKKPKGSVKGSKYNRVTPVTNVSILRDGYSEPYVTSEENGNKVYKIGSSSKMISGQHEYVISYSLKNFINSFKDHDELYFNAVGNGWDVPISRIVAIVTINGVNDLNSLQVACFQGAYGSSLMCSEESKVRENKILFSNGSLDGYSGMSIVVGVEKDVLAPEPPEIKEIWTAASAFRITTATIIGFLATLALSVFGVFLLLYKKARDKRFVGSVIDVAFGNTTGEEVSRPLLTRDNFPVEFIPPEHIRPGQVGVLVDEKVDNVDITATIIDLAVRGYVQLGEKELENNSLFSLRKTKTMYWIAKKKDYTNDTTLMPYEHKVLEALFLEKESFYLSELTVDQGKKFGELIDEMYKEMVRMKWYSHRPDKTRSVWMFISIILTGISIDLVGVIASSTHFGFSALGFPIGAGILVLLHNRMPSRTAAGTAMVGRIGGFRQIFDVGEGERQAFAERSNLFLEYLPYAIVFGCAAKWTEIFESIGFTREQLQIDSFYSGSSDFSLLGFTYVMNSFSQAATGAITHAQNAYSSSISSGSSGFGGGGFSGGGGGGGGGGSW